MYVYIYVLKVVVVVVEVVVVVVVVARKGELRELEASRGRLEAILYYAMLQYNII